ncbi:YdcF family protein [Aerosakkonemataceae cyanobacterium BLCC-F154]|uniref:YdcF family protein n=1 Tax=Floridaenema fluviatile BLCC-F154 TaxID=3153640 RepID=A0ABV4YGV1_9CYAN
MFLFLSKLLPIFIYPLGLSCLLLIAAFIMIWRQPKWAAGLISLALIILFLFSNAWVSSALMRSLEWQNIPEGELPNAAAIVILGGSVVPKVPPRPWVEISEEGDRILYGAKLYREGKAAKVILSGGRINWKNTGASESQDMAELVETMGVPQSAILQDPTSLNTYENAVNVRKILDSQGIERRVLLVTSALHTPRSLAIFKRQGIDAIPAPTDFITIEQDPNQNTWQGAVLEFLPDAGRLANSTRALKEYIGIVIYRLRGWL